MNPPPAGDQPDGQSGPGGQKPAGKPASTDLGALIKQKRWVYNVLGIEGAGMGYLRLVLRAYVVHHGENPSIAQIISINCVNAVDYSLRPKDPNIIEGGAFMEYYEDHPLLQPISQCVPHSDGLETFNPPIKFTLLKIDHSYVIAEKFELTVVIDDMFKRRTTPPPPAA